MTKTSMGNHANNPVLVEVCRAGVVESVHHGAYVVVENGKVIRSKGDVNMGVYYRSSAKPIQALALFLSGAAERFDLTEIEIATACASHHSEPEQIRVVDGMLKKAGLNRGALHCGPDYPAEEKDGSRKGVKEPVYHNCSGKHAGMLLACVQQNFPLDNYLDPEHPLQKQMKGYISKFCEWPEQDIHLGVDGCGAPVFYLPLRNTAIGFQNFANPEKFGKVWASHCHRIRNAMSANQWYVSGTGHFSVTLAQASGNTLLIKSGAEGIACAGIPGKNIGIAVKADDGANRGFIPPTAKLLLEFGAVKDGPQLDDLLRHVRKNSQGKTVGDQKVLL